MSRSFKALVYYRLDNLTHSLFGATLARTPLGACRPRHHGRARARLQRTRHRHRADRRRRAEISRVAPRHDARSARHRRTRHRVAHRSSGSDGASTIGAGRGHATRREHDASFGMLIAVSMIGVLLHVLMDLPTSYGTRLLSPFDWHWFAVDWMPIVDIYLLDGRWSSACFGQPTAGASRARKAGDRPGADGDQLRRARRRAPPGARCWRRACSDRRCRRRCDPQRRRPAARSIRGRADRRRRAAPPGRRCLVEIARCRRSPRRSAGESSRRCRTPTRCTTSICSIAGFATRNAGPPRRGGMTLRYPNVWTPPVMQAATTHVGQVFLGFSRLPAARSAVDEGRHDDGSLDRHAVRRRRARDQQTPRALPFTATVRIGAGRHGSSTNTSACAAMPRFGAHMSVAGGLPRAVERAVVHRCDALQIFAKNASQWRGRAAAARGDPRVPRAGESRRASARSSRTPAI